MYKLLQLHMKSNPEYLFGHAEIAGMLAKGDDKVSSYQGYERECDKKGVISYGEEVYNQFMIDCKRTIKLDLAHVVRS